MAVLAVGLVLSLLVFPSLLKDVPATFATITGFATLYGLIFTVIEVVRTKAAASEAADAADEARRAVASLYDIRDGSECLSLIETALSGIEREGTVQLALLARIVKLYSATFHEEQKDDGSPQRQAVAMVESYSLLAKPKSAPTGRLKGALMSMTTHLSSTGSSKVLGAARQ